MSEYRAIPGFDGYYSSADGRVFSIRRGTLKESKQTWTGRYFYVQTSIERRRRFVAVHRLVAIAWVPGYAEGLTVNHRNGDRKNNNSSNLEWVTAQENIEHAFTSGLRSSKGESNPKAKLTSSDVLKIKNLKQAGTPITQIAAQFDVRPCTIQDICYRRRWTHIASAS